jgi:hypothetical protein
MPEVEVERLHELLVRARAICELTRVAGQYEVAEALRPDTVEACLLMVEDLLGHALAHLPALDTCHAPELNGNGRPKGNRG